MLRRMLVAVLVLTLATLAFGQKKSKEPQEKSVSGIVTDAGGNPVPGAIVQLKNMKTLQVRSFIAKDMGDYYFRGWRQTSITSSKPMPMANRARREPSVRSTAIPRRRSIFS